ncbi:PorP/SprF family type IX secretion system membrane protein [Sphingobacterium psychroaquaticum]|uniref:Type IX secretion system membrane protein, PorP/SprF family n=1 Tax=Sphingobacterium psychroaquaticum TaxID=561061 RepID=A0A1X7I212_9SPHI|nr:type IX secretion system membrane protein PorP/SprF [Sphingobacterium psychroaquaticum]QBQ41989.1 type IX secretion system membrane protein PorP/SprF [Sphingobacterium psychroaquaticum]SMG08363.1 type IX secretion system membrane protein, PorP/SprF family [Sphingobacterium psychroaquaticum]
MKSQRLKVLFCCAAALLMGKSYAQQSIQFTQYIFNSISVNPAYTGYKEEWFGQMALRSQWTGWDGAPKTGSVSIDGVVDPVNKRHGVGLQVTADKLGAQSATSIYANYALRLQLNSEDTERLALGVAGGFTQYGLDGNKLQAVETGDVVIPAGKITSWRPDIRLGVYYYNPKWYAGVSVQDLFANSSSNDEFRFNENSLESLYRNVSMYVIGGALFELDRGTHFRPSILVKDDFKGPTSLDVNAMFIFNNKFWIGAGYRTRARIFKREYFDQSPLKLSATNAITAIAQFYATDRFRIGYSYDIMLNRMRGLQNGSHEVTLGVTFGTVKQLLSPRFF